MVAPQDPQRGRLARAAAFSTCARADALAKISSVIVSTNLVLDRILSPLSSAVNWLAFRLLKVYTGSRPREPTEHGYFCDTLKSYDLNSAAKQLPAVPFALGKRRD